MDDSITKEQYLFLREIVALCDNDVAHPVSVFAAAIKAGVTKVRCQHLILSLMEMDLCHTLTPDMHICCTTKGIMYCHHRQGNIIVRLWHSHTEAIIRGIIGACGAICGSMLTLFIRHWIMHAH